jgi:uncharacterized membrane protein YfcA
MEPLSFSAHFFLWLAGLLAGFVDAIAGGGGIISLPALLATGMPPHLALGTNKLQGSFGSLTAAVNYSRSGLVNMREIPMGIVFTALGALTGTVIVQVLSADFLRHIILFLLAGFWSGGNVIVSAGLLMGAGQMLGASLGSRLVIQKGTGFVRLFFLVVVAATIIKLAYNTYAAG